MYKLIFKENLKMYRERAGYSSAKEFSEKLGIPYQNYMNYENKGNEPKFELLIKIAELLGVTIDELLGREREHSLFLKAKKAIEQAGFEVTPDSSIWANAKRITITYPSTYKGEEVGYNRILLRNDFIKIVSQIVEECEVMKEAFFHQKVKDYLFDEFVTKKMDK